MKCAECEKKVNSVINFYNSFYCLNCYFIFRIKELEIENKVADIRLKNAKAEQIENKCIIL